MRKLSSKQVREAREPFQFGCSIVVFPAEEIAALNEYGDFLTALASGKVLPSNATHRHFLMVHRGEAEPKSVQEKAWVRLKNRREYEQEENAKADSEAPAPPKDYGMEEFDADRCWW